MKKLNQKVKKRKEVLTDERWLRLAVGLGAILIGLLMLIAPRTSLLIVSIMVGLVALLKSISGIYGYYISKKLGSRLFLALDIVLLVVGITCLVKPDFFIQIIAYVLAVWMLFEGLTNLNKIYRLKPAKRRLKIIDFILNLILLLASLTLVVFPNLMGLSLSIMTGVVLLMFGADSIVRAIGLFDAV